MAIILENRSFLLFIEPAGKCHEPIIDQYTKKITGAFRSAKTGSSNYGNVARGRESDAFFKEDSGGWRGIHICECGASSSNEEYAMPTLDDASRVNDQQIALTNSLCIHYVACHRDAVPVEMLERIMLLVADEADPTSAELDLQ